MYVCACAFSVSLVLILCTLPLTLVWGTCIKIPQRTQIFCWGNFWISKIRELADVQTTNIRIANPRVLCENQKMDLIQYLPNLHQLSVPKMGQGCRYLFFLFILLMSEVIQNMADMSVVNLQFCICSPILTS